VARFAYKAGDEYALKLSKLGNTKTMAEKALKSGASIVADKIRSNAENVLSNEATGAMMKSFGIAPVDMDNQGNWNTKIGFDGYDENGVPNQLKARALESGTSKIEKRPFVRPAVNSTKKQCEQAIQEVIDNEIMKIMG
jgi:HK97 gp10 family phage protein